MRTFLTLAVLTLLSQAMPAIADDAITITMNRVTPEGVGSSVGTIKLIPFGSGTRIEAHLKDLSPGNHGMHLHENPDCGTSKKDGVVVPGGAAGGHYDPDKTRKHLGPTGDGHKGDLPFINAHSNGTVSDTLLAPHLKLSDFKGRSIVVHNGADNYSDVPAPLGGGGARFACGVVK